MKKIALLLLFVGMMGMAQIKGDKNIQTRTFPAEKLTDLEIGLYANIVVDQNAKEGITITVDDNLFGHIETEVVDGRLKLDQKEWIQASERIEISIGARMIQRVQLGTNNVVKVINLNTEAFSAMALNGEIQINGKTNVLGVGAENGLVDASGTEAREVFLNIWGHGKAIIGPIDLLEAKLGGEAQLELTTEPKKIKGNIANAISNANPSKKGMVRYISFKIRNNSTNRNNFYVIGPKPDGRKFSYGFPMMPGKIRKEKWTTGTKIYKVGQLGLRKLLITIKARDEDQTVDLF